VKEAVFPFNKFPGIDTILGPEMKSTGEVMGVGASFAEAFLKSQAASSIKLPAQGKVFLSVKDSDKDKVAAIARDLCDAGFFLLATRGTAATIAAAGIPVVVVNKVTEGRPHVVDMIKNNEIALIINTVDEKRKAINDSRSIRTSALATRVTLYTTLWGAEAAAIGIKNRGELVVYPLQTLHARLA
ncbi:MAG: carbamoyl phosphate synthase large subunit, partial [Clostridiales Family XIII bacterium]|nr:carbamoyl phosphate synthase large subunit [Clostridiales Family XIII bacterium]